MDMKNLYFLIIQTLTTGSQPSITGNHSLITGNHSPIIGNQRAKVNSGGLQCTVIQYFPERSFQCFSNLKAFLLLIVTFRH